MSTIDIFSRIQIPKEEVFKHLISSHTISRCVSPFFKIENLNCSNSRLDLDSYFTQKCVLSELLQLFFNVKEIVPDKKILFQFEGLIKGKQCINLLEDENGCILKERIDFSLYNYFNFPVLDTFLALFFYLDTCIKHLRLKNILYKDSKMKSLLKDYSAIRSYIVIDADLKVINSFFNDLNKFALWISPFVKVTSLNHKQELEEGTEFSLEFMVPFIQSVHCKISKKQLNKIIISFSNSFLSGKNIWSIFPCENELVIENTLELDDILIYLQIAWLLIGNTLLRKELKNWNKRLKEIAERTSLTKYLDLTLNQI